METTNETTTLDWVKSLIIERLSDYANTTTYGCDLAYKLFEGENANGSVFCNTFKTVEFIKANYDLFGEFLEQYESNFGTMLNPFSEPEKCHVIFLLESASAVMSNCEFISENWNNKIQLTDEVINTITEQVNGFNGDLF